MKHLFAVLVSLMSVTSSSASDRIYATGCIPSTPEDWERAGVPLRSPSEELRSSRVARLSCGAGIGITHFSQGATAVALELPKRKCLKHKMSDVQYQGDLGACSCFSCAAAIEGQLNPGTKISEAELYIRGKTRGRDDRLTEGLPLSILVSILPTGALLSQHFPDYSTYEKYVLNVLRDINGASLSRDYDESIDHFRQYCREHVPDYKEPTSATMIPPRYQAPSGLFGLFVAFNPMPKLLTGTMGKMLDPARRMRLALRTERIYEKGKTPPAQFITDLKLSLLKEIPVVVSVETFAKYEKVAAGTGSYIKLVKDDKTKYIFVGTGEGDYKKSQWLTASQYIQDNNNLVTQNYQDYGYKHEGYHAICVCGYNDTYQPKPSKPAVKAVQIKNSWGNTWGSEGNGYAWLTLEYLESSIDEPIVIEVQKGS